MKDVVTVSVRGGDGHHHVIRFDRAVKANHIVAYRSVVAMWNAGRITLSEAAKLNRLVGQLVR